LAGEHQIKELISKMAIERDGLLSLMESLPDQDASAQPEDGEGEAQWSVKQQAAHLAEMETAYRAWVGLALARQNPDVTRVRGEPVGIPIERANEHPISELISQLRHQRGKTLSMIESLRPSDYERTATQTMFGTLTVLQWLRSFYRHDRMHQDQIAGRESSYKPRYATGSEPDQRRNRVT
jgi:hypothetical protein